MGYRNSVLEEAGEASTVAVWRWHGWGFSLAWRSPPGSYRDLTLLPGEGGWVISVAEGLTPRRRAAHDGRGPCALASLRDTR